MKKRKTYLFSLVSFLFVLLIIGQQEIEKTKNLLTDLKEKEVNSFVFTTHDFASIVKQKANPFILLTNTKAIEQLLISKCRLGENTFLREANGQDIVLNSYGDAGIIQYELGRGGKIIVADKTKELDYFRRVAIPTFETLGFNFWEIVWYFSRQICFILLFTFLPFFFSLKLLIFTISILVLILTVLSARRVTKVEKVSDKIVKEYCLKKIPPKLCVDTVSLDNHFPSHEFIIPRTDCCAPLAETKIFFPFLSVGGTRKALRKIFHIPKYGFVMNEKAIFNHLTKLYIKWKMKVNTKPMDYWENCQTIFASYG